MTIQPHERDKTKVVQTANRFILATTQRPWRGFIRWTPVLLSNRNYNKALCICRRNQLEIR